MIQIAHLYKSFGAQQVLRDVTLDIPAGQIVGLLGPNGAGKSTLMKIISCFIPPTSGRVTVKGFDVMENPIEVKKIVGYLPEHNPLYLDMYVREYLQFVAGVHHITGKAASQRIDEMIEATGLGIEAHKKIGALSKGYRQRVGLAQAMIHNPEVLILDEPTSGLDPNQLVDIRNLIMELGREKTVLFSTHIMQEVDAVCSRAIIINKGVVVADDKVENLKLSTGNVLTVEFESETTQQALQHIAGVKSVKQSKNGIWLIEPIGDTDIREELIRWSLDNHLTIKSMQQREISMEEAFQDLTSK